MSVIGKIESLWRYPVKSMGGEALNEALTSRYCGVHLMIETRSSDTGMIRPQRKAQRDRERTKDQMRERREIRAQTF